jgi:hypothetical protein
MTLMLRPRQGAAPGKSGSETIIDPAHLAEDAAALRGFLSQFRPEILPALLIAWETWSNEWLATIDIGSTRNVTLANERTSAAS